MKIQRKHILLIGLTCLLAAPITNVQAQQPTSIRLNDNWKFVKSDLGGIWEAVRTYKAGDHALPDRISLLAFQGFLYTDKARQSCSLHEPERSG